MAIIRNPITVVQECGSVGERDYSTEANAYGETAIIEVPTEYTGSYTITENGTVPCSGKKMTADLSVDVESGSGDYVGIIIIQGEDYGRSISLSDGSTPTLLDGYYFYVPVGLTCSVSYQYDALVSFKAIGLDGTQYEGNGNERWNKVTVGSDLKVGVFNCVGVD